MKSSCHFRSGLERAKQCFGVLARIDLVYRLSYAAIGAYHVCDAFGVLSAAVVARPVSHAYLSLRVAEQAEGEVEFFGKGSVLFHRVKADA
jgi:hypothetical protein